MQVIHEVSRRRPRLLVGAHQGALLVLLCALPLVVEAALRARVSTEAELVAARNTWGAVEGFVGIEPFLQSQYLDMNLLGQALPEAFVAQRKLKPAVVVAPSGGHRKLVEFWDSESPAWQSRWLSVTRWRRLTRSVSRTRVCRTAGSVGARRSSIVVVPASFHCISSVQPATPRRQTCYVPRARRWRCPGIPRVWGARTRGMRARGLIGLQGMRGSLNSASP